MIVRGTHTPGVPDSVFDGPPHTALRYERPDPRVSDYVTDYYVLDSEGPEVMGAIEWSLPGSPNIRLFLDDRPVNVTIGRRVYAPTPPAALYGPTSQAMRVEAFGGVTVGMGVSALGWARLFSRPASRFTDRILPLGEAWRPHLADILFDRLKASDQSLEVKGVLDAFFLEHLGAPHPDEPLVRRIIQLLTDEKVGEIGTIARDLDLTPQQLRNTTLRYFGFPPKRLLRRTRFLRSLLRMYAAGDEADYSLISASYFDVSHFLRDSEEFLGTTPRRFMARQTPFLRQVIRARKAVFGVPAQVLHPIGPPPAKG